MNSLKTAVATLFKTTKQMQSLDFKLASVQNEAVSLLHRKRILKALESKSELLETALDQVTYIRSNLNDCLDLEMYQIDMIMRLVSLCDKMAVEHIGQVQDLEYLCLA